MELGQIDLVLGMLLGLSELLGLQRKYKAGSILGGLGGIVKSIWGKRKK